jgi:hypothetical protein
VVGDVVSDPTTDNDGPFEDELEEVEDDDDLRQDAAALFGVDAGDGPLPPIDVDALNGDDNGAIATHTGSTSTATHGTSTVVSANLLSGWIFMRSKMLMM